MIRKPFLTTNSENIEEGLIHLLTERNRVEKFIQTSGYNFRNGNSSSLLEWGTKWQVDKGDSLPFLRFFFPNGGITINKFAFQTADNLCYTPALILYGFRNDTIEFLDNYNLEEICGPNRYCSTSESTMFSLPDSISYFDSILITTTNGSCPNNYHISGSGIEFFGTLYKYISLKTCKLNPNFNFQLLLNIFILIKM